jgi:predicted transcriptional regulator
MSNKRIPRPTEAELSILRVLWRRGPSTVRDVHADLSRAAAERSDAATGYTTALKLLQIMTDKGLTVREEEGRRAHLYAAAVPEEQVQRRFVRELLDGVFGGSAKRLVVQALSERPASAEELAEVRRLLDEIEGKEGNDR